MKKFERVLGIICTVGLVLNFLLIPGGTVLSILGWCTLSGFYMYLSFALFNEIPLKRMLKKTSYASVSTRRIIGSVLTGVCLSLVALGILFKFQSYPGANFNLNLGVTGLALASVIGVINQQKDQAPFYKAFFMRIALIGGLGLILTLLPDFTIMELKYRNYPDYVKAFKYAVDHPENPELWEVVNEEREKI